MRLTFLLPALFLVATSVVGQDNFKMMKYADFKSDYLQPNDELVIFNFWATWCKPCVEELPYFLQLAREKQIRLVLVSLDFPRHVDKKVLPFIRQQGITEEVILLDEANAGVFIDDIDPNWEGSIPATLLWQQGKVGFFEGSFHSTDELQAFITKSLKP
jgi:thiol-disulfide isomerase/thioredoxin